MSDTPNADLESLAGEWEEYAATLCAGCDSCDGARRQTYLAPAAVLRDGERAKWEVAVLNRFFESMPATGEASDYVRALAGAMLHVRPEGYRKTPGQDQGRRAS